MSCRKDIETILHKTPTEVNDGGGGGGKKFRDILFLFAVTGEAAVAVTLIIRMREDCIGRHSKKPCNFQRT